MEPYLSGKSRIRPRKALTIKPFPTMIGGLLLSRGFALFDS